MLRVSFVTSFGNPAIDEMSILAPLKQCKQYVLLFSSIKSVGYVTRFLHQTYCVTYMPYKTVVCMLVYYYCIIVW